VAGGGPDTIENCVSAWSAVQRARITVTSFPGHKGPAPKIPTTETSPRPWRDLQAARRRSPAAKCATSTQSAVPCRPPDIPQPAVSGRSLTASAQAACDASVSLRDVGFTSNRGDRCPADFKRCRSIAANLKYRRFDPMLRSLLNLSTSAINSLASHEADTDTSPKPCVFLPARLIPFTTDPVTRCLRR